MFLPITYRLMSVVKLCIWLFDPMMPIAAAVEVQLLNRA